MNTNKLVVWLVWDDHFQPQAVFDLGQDDKVEAFVTALSKRYDGRIIQTGVNYNPEVTKDIP